MCIAEFQGGLAVSEAFPTLHSQGKAHQEHFKGCQAHEVGLVTHFEPVAIKKNVSSAQARMLAGTRLLTKPRLICCRGTYTKPGLDLGQEQAWSPPCSPYKGRASKPLFPSSRLSIVGELHTYASHVGWKKRAERFLKGALKKAKE
eukprot:scaffold14437_cov22-Tisochrysis_lutea.AAC.1